MLWGGPSGGLEVRQSDGGGVLLRGAFPYNQETELAPGRFERFEARAFKVVGDGIALLAQHDITKPLASVDAGSLTIRDGDDALAFEATVSGATTWQRDTLAALEAGLVRGVSPGFRVPDGGAVTERRGNGLLRRITRADLFEISLVTRAAYPAAQVEARAWGLGVATTPLTARQRWRA